MDWERFYATHSLAIDRTDYLTQVGHTENGAPIDEERFRWIVSRISELLDLRDSDRLLDLCGNGVGRDRKLEEAGRQRLSTLRPFQTP